MSHFGVTALHRLAKITDKELNRYPRDFEREAEAVGMLIKLNERRKIG